MEKFLRTSFRKSRMSSDLAVNDTEQGTLSPESGAKSVEIEGISLSLEGNLTKIRELFRLRDDIQVNKSNYKPAKLSRTVLKKLYFSFRTFLR